MGKSWRFMKISLWNCRSTKGIISGSGCLLESTDLCSASSQIAVVAMLPKNTSQQQGYSSGFHFPREIKEADMAP